VLGDSQKRQIKESLRHAVRSVQPKLWILCLNRKRVKFPSGGCSVVALSVRLFLGGRLLSVSRYAGGLSGWHVPGQELCDAVDWVFGDVGQDVSQVALGVDAVELGCTKQ